MRTISKEWLAFLREQFPRGSQVICWELDDPEHISTGTLEQIDEEGRFHTRMGDGAIRKLALGEEQFSVQPPEPTLLKLYMPLTADFYGRDEWGDIDETGEEWDGRTLLDYEDQIQGALVRNRMPEEKERGVMRWYDKQDSLNIKVRSAEFTAEERSGQLWGVAECRVVGELSPEELSTLTWTPEQIPEKQRNLMSCLAFQGDDKAMATLLELERKPKPWRNGLYVDPSNYAQCSSWTFDKERHWMQLNFDTCYPKVTQTRE